MKSKELRMLVVMLLLGLFFLGLVLLSTKYTYAVHKQMRTEIEQVKAELKYDMQTIKIYGYARERK